MQQHAQRDIQRQQRCCQKLTSLQQVPTFIGGLARRHATPAGQPHFQQLSPHNRGAHILQYMQEAVPRWRGLGASMDCRPTHANQWMQQKLT